MSAWPGRSMWYVSAGHGARAGRCSSTHLEPFLQLRLGTVQPRSVPGVAWKIRGMTGGAQHSRCQQHRMVSAQGAALWWRALPDSSEIFSARLAVPRPRLELCLAEQLRKRKENPSRSSTKAS
eukprot:1678896-Rhodomonas_salina.1